MTDHGSSYSFKNGFGPTEHSDAGRKHPQSPASMPPMNDVELDKILTTLENLVAIDVQQRIVAHKSGQSPKKSHAEAKQAIQALFAQEKANLQAALEAELPERGYTLNDDIPTKVKVTLFGGDNAEELRDTHNSVLDKTHKAIAAVFNKGGK